MTMEMNKEEVASFLSQPLHAIMATMSRQGPPQLSPVWFIEDGGSIYISIVAGCAKQRNLERDPRASLCIDGGRRDVRAVMLYGTTRLIESGDALNIWRWRIIRHYYERESDARAYFESIEHTPSVLVIFDPDRIVSQDFRD